MGTQEKMEGITSRLAKGAMSMFRDRELTYSPEQQRDPGITIATINLPF